MHGSSSPAAAARPHTLVQVDGDDAEVVRLANGTDALVGDNVDNLEVRFVTGVRRRGPRLLRETRRAHSLQR